MKSDARSDGHKGMQTSAHALVAGADPSCREYDRSEAAKLAYGVVEAARAIGVSRSALYELNKQGAIRFVKCGRRTLILHEDLIAFLQSLR